MGNVKSVGIIGYGAFGSFAHTLLTAFAPEVRVTAYSIDREVDHKLFFPLTEVCKSDAVILAVPINVYEEVIRQIVPLLSPHAILIDIATVKALTLDALRKHASGIQYISTHPMFGPQSYEKRNHTVDGFRIVVCEHTLSDEDYEMIRNFLSAFGFVVVELDADEHDKLLAESLFLTHYVAQTILKAGFVRTNIDTVSFHSLMDAVLSVKDDKKLFEDVYRFNPYCKEVAERLRDAGEQVLEEIENEG